MTFSFVLVFLLVHFQYISGRAATTVTNGNVLCQNTKHSTSCSMSCGSGDKNARF